MVRIATDGHNGIPCPHCGARLEAKRTIAIGDCIRRQRRCPSCDRRFRTIETIQSEEPPKAKTC